MSPLTNLTCTHTLHTVCFHINVLINSDNNSNSNNNKKKIDAKQKKKFFMFVRLFMSMLHRNQTRIIYVWLCVWLETGKCNFHNTTFVLCLSISVCLACTFQCSLQQCKWIRYTNRALWSLICIIQVNKCDWTIALVCLLCSIFSLSLCLFVFFLFVCFLWNTVKSSHQMQLVLAPNGWLFYRFNSPFLANSIQFSYQFRIYFNPNISNNLFNMCECIF